LHAGCGESTSPFAPNCLEYLEIFCACGSANLVIVNTNDSQNEGLWKRVLLPQNPMVDGVYKTSSRGSDGKVLESVAQKNHTLSKDQRGTKQRSGRGDICRLARRLRQFIVDYTEKWAKIIRAAGVKAE
jgi:hypothetical protein